MTTSSYPFPFPLPTRTHGADLGSLLSFGLLCNGVLIYITHMVLTEDAARRLTHVQPKRHLKALLATQVLSTVTHDVDIRRDVECRLVKALEIVAAAEDA